jgi:hypothetical protein
MMHADQAMSNNATNDAGRIIFEKEGKEANE